MIKAFNILFICCLLAVIFGSRIKDITWELVSLVSKSREVNIITKDYLNAQYIEMVNEIK